MRLRTIFHHSTCDILVGNKGTVFGTWCDVSGTQNEWFIWELRAWLVQLFAFPISTWAGLCRTLALLTLLGMFLFAFILKLIWRRTIKSPPTFGCLTAAPTPTLSERPSCSINRASCQFYACAIVVWEPISWNIWVILGTTLWLKYDNPQITIRIIFDTPSANGSQWRGQ